MKQETKRLSSVIVAGLIIVAAIVVYFEFIVPAYTSLEVLKGQEESAAMLYTNETAIANQIKSLLSTYQNNTSTNQEVAMALPVGPDVSGALAQIYGIAASAGITVQGMGVSTQAVQETAPSAIVAIATSSGLSNAAAAGSIIKPTGIVSLQVTGTGSYESFKNFLHGFETNIRIFDVTAISLQPAAIAATKTQAANQDMFNYTITVATYYQAS